MHFFRTQYIAYITMMRREYVRIVRIWAQTLLPPLITTGLYFLIFGQLIGSQVGGIAGFSYMQYIAPGLILMSIATAGFSNVVFSFYFAKFQRSLEEILVAPVHPLTIVLGFVSGGIMRALLVTFLSILMMLLFIPLSVASVSAAIFFSFGTALLFSLGGMINAIYANKIDSLSIFSTFILTPLTYFGGVFYSLSLLPEFWQKLSYLNPVMYLINGFRYGFLGVSDVSMWACVSVLTGLIGIAILWLLLLFKQGRGLKI